MFPYPLQNIKLLPTQIYKILFLLFNIKKWMGIFS